MCCFGNTNVLLASVFLKFYVDDEQFRTLVAWLEDTYIRVYKIEDRTPIRTFNDTWNNTFVQVL